MAVLERRLCRVLPGDSDYPGEDRFEPSGTGAEADSVIAAGSPRRHQPKETAMEKTEDRSTAQSTRAPPSGGVFVSVCDSNLTASVLKLNHSTIAHADKRPNSGK